MSILVHVVHVTARDTHRNEHIRPERQTERESVRGRETERETITGTKSYIAHASHTKLKQTKQRDKIRYENRKVLKLPYSDRRAGPLVVRHRKFAPV